MSVRPPGIRFTRSEKNSDGSVSIYAVSSDGKEYEYLILDGMVGDPILRMLKAKRQNTGLIMKKLKPYLVKKECKEMKRLRLLKLLSEQVGDGENRGLLIALPIPDDIAKTICLKDDDEAEKPTDMHITLAYCGRYADLSEGVDEKAISAIKEALKGFGPVEGKIGGIGRFNASETSDGRDVLYASVDMSKLVDLRHKVVEVLEKAGIPVKKEHGFSPHVTLKYFEKGGDWPINRMDDIQLEVDKVIITKMEGSEEISLA